MDKFFIKRRKVEDEAVTDSFNSNKSESKLIPRVSVVKTAQDLGGGVNHRTYWNSP